MKRSHSLRFWVGLLFLLGWLPLGDVGAQFPPQGPAPPPPVNPSDDPLLKNFRWRSIGPASMGGRIDDIAVVESNPSIIYIGIARGAVAFRCRHVLQR